MKKILQEEYSTRLQEFLETQGPQGEGPFGKLAWRTIQADYFKKKMLAEDYDLTGINTQPDFVLEFKSGLGVRFDHENDKGKS